MNIKGKQQILSVNQPGKIYGLSLTLFDKLPNPLKRIVPDYGFTIKIGNSTDRGPDGIDILSGGVETSIAVHKVISRQLPEPYSNCLIDNENPKNYDSVLYKMFQDSNTQYSQQICIDACIQIYFIESCNCTSNAFFSFFNVKNCNTDSQILCSIKTYLEKISKNETFIDQNCIQKGFCPLECNRTEFKISLSYSKFSTELYLDYMKSHQGFESKYDENKSIEMEDVNDGLVKINIFYESLTYTDFTESVSISLAGLGSRIGGFMGMFLGMSLMTLVEILEIIIKFVQKIFLRGKNALHF